MSAPQIEDRLVARAVNQVLSHRILNGVPLDGKLETRVKPDFNTACWTYEREKGCHQIFIGDKIIPYDRQKPGMTDEDKVALYGAYMKHELCHADWSTRNFALINRLCKDAGAPFSLWNLMEDARIEHKYRETFKEPLGWSKWVGSEVEDNGNPTALLFKMVENETREVTGSDPELLKKVQGFYDRIVEAKNSIALAPVLKDWMTEFAPEMAKNKQAEQARDQDGGQGQQQGQPRPDDQGQPDPSGEGAKPGQPRPGQEKDGNTLSERNEMSLGAQLQANPEMLQEFKDSSKDVKELLVPGGGKEKSDGQRAEEQLRAELRPARLNPDEVKATADTLAKAMVAPEARTTTMTPTKTLNKKAIGNPSVRNQFSRKTDPVKKRLKINLLVDGSGSMQGVPEQQAGTLIAALHLLALQGLAEGTVFNSTTSGYTQFDLKNPQCVRAGAARGGAEGLERTYRAIHRQMQTADANLVFTDGMLADEPINKAVWRAKGIETVGLYVGTTERLTDLNKYFDKAIIRPNIQEVAFAIQDLFSRGRDMGRGGGR